MSQYRVTQSKVTDSALLTRACERMRNASINVVGPRYEKNYPGVHYGSKREAWQVTLPGAYSPCTFFCDKEGNVGRDQDAAYGGSANHYGRLMQEYGVAFAEREAERLGGRLEFGPMSEDQKELSVEIVYG